MTDQSTTPTPDPDREALRGLFWDYLQGGLSLQDTRSLEAALEQDPEAVADCNDLVELGVMTGELCQRSGAARKVLADTIRDGLDDSGAHDVLAELARLEGQAPAALVRLDDADAPAPQSRGFKDDTLSAREVLSISGYLLGRSLRSRLALYAYAAGLALLAAVLLVPWGGEPSPQTAQQASPNPSPQTAPVAVATLTGENDAQWAAFGPVLGDTLFAGQRLTLTAGFAEITTAQGAVAILEAPARIELLDNHNALRLHAGKLVGICEVPSSHGFTVHTPLAKVRDIGTRFGVQQADGRTQIGVFSGEVFATARGHHDNKPVSLTVGQHAEVTQATGELVRIDRPDTRYVDAWSAVADRPRLTGEVRYEPAMPLSLLPGDEEGNLPVVFAERSRVSLPAGFEVTLASPGTYVHNTAFKQVALGDDAIVDCYFIHFDPPDQPRDGQGHLYQEKTATIHFDRPIVGVITLPQHLLASAARLDRPGVRYRPDRSPHPGPPVEGLGVTNTRVDIIRLSADRRTLEFTLHAGPHADQFRVLVRSDPEQTHPEQTHPEQTHPEQTQ